MSSRIGVLIFVLLMTVVVFGETNDGSSNSYVKKYICGPFLDYSIERMSSAQLKEIRNSYFDIENKKLISQYLFVDLGEKAVLETDYQNKYGFLKMRVSRTGLQPFGQRNLSLYKSIYPVSVNILSNPITNFDSVLWGVFSVNKNSMGLLVAAGGDAVSICVDELMASVDSFDEIVSKVNLGEVKKLVQILSQHKGYEAEFYRAGRVLKDGVKFLKGMTIPFDEYEFDDTVLESAKLNGELTVGALLLGLIAGVGLRNPSAVVAVLGAGSTASAYGEREQFYESDINDLSNQKSLHYEQLKEKYWPANLQNP